jgi:hypothetical protein
LETDKYNCGVRSGAVIVQAGSDQISHENADEGVNLISHDIAALRVHRTAARDWLTGVEQSGRPVGRPGVLQELELKGVKARVHLAEFGSEDDARAEAASYVTNMAAVFYPGVIEGTTNKLVVDQSWYSRNSNNTALLIRTGKTLALVSCRNGTSDEQKETVVVLAARIADKVRSGKRVIVPKLAAN